MKERTDFEEYNSGFFYKRFNRVLKLIRKNRVLPIRPGWEQTTDGIVPPPIYNAQALAARPFQVTVRQDEDTNEVQASVNTGYYANFGSAFFLPSWAGESDFNTFETISSTSTLILTLTIEQYRTSVEAMPGISSELQWGSTAGTSQIGAEEYEIDFSGDFVTTTKTPETEYTVEIRIANLSISGSDYTLTQYVDYNILVPANVNKFYDIPDAS